ncbi:alpha/beta-hydrolase [Aspergillus sclerotioniger CBS 115572]|uniref:Alpha/beta-hydrolase n=1 Tax=Aspergillus sclerotioniger CBS 115572 TaxID=1450535 RepID=A0A317W5Z3_9EURO|nr:alpha/beta-hydrolase [Aspergillus sclerotioniger CBS 115572]PWY81509.1 alpha/beta-hydrolase [Aspergillus sclerotioniger CBS 115572]
MPSLAHAVRIAGLLLSLASATVAGPVSTPSINTSLPLLDCGELQVPIDWANPQGDQVTLGMARYRASDPTSKLGSLIFNPGGPGTPASEVVELAPYVFGNALLEHFDIIGLDPRGVGLSSPIRCDPSIYNQRVSNFPTTEVEFQTMQQKYRTLGQSCGNLTGPLMAHLDSASVARDVEAVRMALGEAKLNYLGLSYGTLLGAQYAQLFPQNIRAMALDGNMDHNEACTYSLVVPSSAYETELVRFGSWCAWNSSCALHGTDVLQLFDNLTAQADHHPIPAPGCNISGACRSDVTGEELRDNLRDWLSFKDPPAQLGLTGWADLSVALAQASAGNATLLSTQLALDSSSSLFPELAIYCLDWSQDSRSLADVRNKQEMTATLMPHTRGAVEANMPQVQCLGWPFPVQNPEHNARINNTSPILLVNAQYDPLTSLTWAVGLQDQIRESVLLTRAGDGHTSYVLQGETSRAIDAYLVNLTLPAANTVLPS